MVIRYHYSVLNPSNYTKSEFSDTLLLLLLEVSFISVLYHQLTLSTVQLKTKEHWISKWMPNQLNRLQQNLVILGSEKLSKPCGCILFKYFVLKWNDVFETLLFFYFYSNGSQYMTQTFYKPTHRFKHSSYWIKSNSHDKWLTS